MNLCVFNKVSWYEGVCYKVSVEWELMKQTMTGLYKNFSGVFNKPHLIKSNVQKDMYIDSEINKTEEYI